LRTEDERWYLQSYFDYKIAVVLLLLLIEVPAPSIGSERT